MRNLKSVFAIAVLLNCISAIAYGKTLVIYHTSDVHGWYSSRPAVWDKANSTRTIGGFAALASLAGKEKDPVIFVDSGDWYQGTPEGNLTKGMASVILMNKLGYSASALGNHEYDYGEDNLRQLISSAAFSALAANIYLKSEGKNTASEKRADYAKPYVIIERNGVKIGIIGLITEETATSTMPEYVKHLHFKDKIPEAAKLVPELKKKGVNAIIALTHSGVCGRCSGQIIDADNFKPSSTDLKEGNIAIARAAKGGIAVIFGGHNHTGLLDRTGILPGYKDKESGTLLVESYAQLTAVSRVEMNFDDKTGKFTGASDKLVNLWTDETGEDPEVLETLKPITDKVGAEMNTVIGQSEADLLRYESGKKTADSSLGNWVTDVMRKAAKAQIAFQNTHGIRADIAKGSVTVRSVYQALPFENTLVTLELTGAQIIELLKDNLHGDASNMQVSGIKVVYSTGEKGAAEAITVSVNGEPLDPAATYKVATNNYLASGGSGGKVFTQGKNISDTMLAIRDLVIEETKASSPISVPEGGRIIRKQ